MNEDKQARLHEYDETITRLEQIKKLTCLSLEGVKALDFAIKELTLDRAIYEDGGELAHAIKQKERMDEESRRHSRETEKLWRETFGCTYAEWLGLDKKKETGNDG